MIHFAEITEDMGHVKIDEQGKNRKILGDKCQCSSWHAELCAMEPRGLATPCQATTRKLGSKHAAKIALGFLCGCACHWEQCQEAPIEAETEVA